MAYDLGYDWQTNDFLLPCTGTVNVTDTWSAVSSLLLTLDQPFSRRANAALCRRGI